MKSVIESIKNHFIFPYLGYIILIVLLVGSNVLWVLKRASYKKLLREHASHISILLTKEKDLSIQVQQGVLKQQICAVTHTQKNNKQKLDKIKTDIESLEGKRKELQKQEEEKRQRLQNKTLKQLKQQLNGEW